MPTIVCVHCKRALPVEAFTAATLASAVARGSRCGLRCSVCQEDLLRANFEKRGVDYDEYRALKAEGRKRCTRCKEIKPLTSFGLYRGKVTGPCWPCQNVIIKECKARKRAEKAN